MCDFTANGYRLPTEKEWEYIAREGSALSSYIYSGSNNIDDVGWYKENSSNTVHYGKCKASNTLGIYDMSGNVEEIAQQEHIKRIYCMTQATFDKYKEQQLIVNKSNIDYYRLYENELWRVVII